MKCVHTRGHKTVLEDERLGRNKNIIGNILFLIKFALPSTVD